MIERSALGLSFGFSSGAALAVVCAAAIVVFVLCCAWVCFWGECLEKLRFVGE
jgi:hypothetical protein